MEKLTKEKLNAKLELIDKWSSFVEISQKRGETESSVRQILASNNLTQEEIEMLMSKDSKTLLQVTISNRNIVNIFFGTILFIASLFCFVFAFYINMRFIFVATFFMGWGIRQIAKYRRI